MNELTLWDAILNAQEPSDELKHLANELKEQCWGEDVMPVELETYVRTAAGKVLSTGDRDVICKDLELFLLKQKQSQTLLLGHSL